ncbi:hypothetical protein [Dyadobacter diqingensis]|uniref:hypothetical protein n=1 Tax=Dyadobacter diqingensis TaxID=2938121 RepID=UPI0020C25CA9|nr:hypothetical protein [Dyadobacter diqingensis]
MSDFPEFAIEVRDGKGYPHDLSTEAVEYFEKNKFKGVFELENPNLSDGKIFNNEEWLLVKQYRKKGEKEWKHDSNFSFQPHYPESGEEYRTVYKIK